MTVDKNPIRRVRVKYLDWHNPPVWAAYYEPPGASACLHHAISLPEMCEFLTRYFNGEAKRPPLRVQDHLMRFVDGDGEYAR